MLLAGRPADIVVEVDGTGQHTSSPCLRHGLQAGSSGACMVSLSAEEGIANRPLVTCSGHAAVPLTPWRKMLVCMLKKESWGEKERERDSTVILTIRDDQHLLHGLLPYS